MIAVVEDEKELCESLKMLLTEKGYEIVTARSCDEADKYIGNPQIDMFLLDVKLPDGSGFDICRKIRKSSEVPVIFLTSCDNEDEIVTGLDIGADDYITKPFSMKELVVRVNTLLRRVRDYNNNYENMSRSYDYDDGNLKINFEKMEVYKSNKLVVFTTNEFRVLQILVEHREKVLSREKIIEKLFEDFYEGYDRNIDTYIKNIRSKIEESSKTPEYVITVYGTGYKFLPHINSE